MMSAIQTEKWKPASGSLFSKLVFCLMCLLSAALPVKTLGAEPNVVVILIDDMGWGDLGCFGHPYHRTPSIDSFAETGTRFENFYSAGSVCSPTRVSIMTGHYPARHRAHAHYSGNTSVNIGREMPDFLDPDQITAADVFRRQGYRTGYFGKWHLAATATAPRPTEYGFDEFQIGWDTNSHFYAFSSELVMGAGQSFIEQDSDKPFYLQLSTFQVHTPVRPHALQLESWEDLSVDLDTFGVWQRDYLGLREDLDVPAREYAAVVEAVDTAVGGFLDYLEENDLTENTIVLLMSDNGPEDYRVGATRNAGTGSPGPFRGRKRSIYEGGIRSPLIARWPGKIPPDRVDSNTIATTADCLPTLCGLVGIEPPDGLDGVDMSGALLGDSSPEVSKFWEYRFGVTGAGLFQAPRLAMRHGRWKFLMEADGSNQQLYDLWNDPSEFNDLAPVAGKAFMRDRAAELAQWAESMENQPLMIVTEPTSQEVELGEPASMKAFATSVPPATYRWKKDGQWLAEGDLYRGTSTQTLLIPHTSMSTEGSYSCVVSNGVASMDTQQARLELIDPVTILRHPVSVLVPSGDEAQFSVEASSGRPVDYQWFFGGQEIIDATNAEVSIPAPYLAGTVFPATESHGVWCVVSNETEQVVTLPAALIVGASVKYSTWAEAEFSDVEAAGPSDDADDDGASNRAEYAFGTNPRDSGSQPLLEAGSEGDSMLVKYHRRAGGYFLGSVYRVGDLSYRIESSSDCLTWRSLPVGLESAITSSRELGNGIAESTLEIEIDRSSAASFWRIAVD